jgi:tetratricopeptide (TPR) repeat protein
MNRLTTTTLSACGAALLLGCATPPPPPAPLAMQPLLRLQHGGTQSAANWYNLGKYHQGRGELNLALGAYAQSLALDGRQLDARMAVAAIDARQGRLAAARDALQSLVADYPAQAQLSNNLGYVYYLMGDQQAAIAMLRRALGLDAASVKAQDNLRLAEAAAGAGAASATLADNEASLPPPTRAEMQQLQQQLHQLQERSAAAGLAPLPASAVDAVLPASVAATAPAAPAAAIPATAQAAVSIPALTATVEATVSATAAAAPVPALAPAPVDIANGNGLQGLAKRFRRALAQLGIPVGRLSNERPYRQQATTIEYRPGYQQQALTLQAALHGLAVLVEAGPQAKTGLRLVLGKDSRSEPMPTAGTGSAQLLTAATATTAGSVKGD